MTRPTPRRTIGATLRERLLSVFQGISLAVGLTAALAPDLLTALVLGTLLSTMGGRELSALFGQSPPAMETWT